MCLAVPARILSLDGEDALCDLGGARARVSVALIDRPAPGDWVIIHTGYALSRIDEDAARDLAAQMDALMAEAAP
jgi:hydrogenase expression/formation protein HypC